MSDLSGAIKRRRGPLTPRERVLAQSLGGLIWSATSFISRSTFSSSSEIGGVSSVDSIPSSAKTASRTRRAVSVSLSESSRASVFFIGRPPLDGGCVLQPFSYKPSYGRRIANPRVWLLEMLAFTNGERPKALAEPKPTHVEQGSSENCHEAITLP